MNKYVSTIFFDTEWTAWEGSVDRNWAGPNEYREIVQIGAIRLDQNYREVESFELIVQPSKNPILSAYFVELTGIDQGRLENEGRPFLEAWALFSSFMTRDVAAVYSNGRDEHILLENLELNCLPRRLPDVQFFDIQPWIRQVAESENKFISTHGFCCVAGVASDYKPHDALADARAMVDAIRILRLIDVGPLPHELSANATVGVDSRVKGGA